MNDPIHPESNAAVSTKSLAGTFFPSGIPLAISVVLLLLAVAVRLLGRMTDPPFPLNDPAIAYLVSVGLIFFAGFSAWLWFCFFSSYSPALKRIALAAPAVGIAALIGTVWAVGFNRILQLDGSMGLRLAPMVGEQGTFKPSSDATSIDLAATTPQDFPQFLGPDRSGRVPGPNLSRDWKATPPKLLWKRPIGQGWSGFSAVNGQAVTMEQRGDEEWVTCYEIATGNPIWGYSVAGRHEKPLGGIGPRSTPTIYQGRVYALTANAVLLCLDGNDGKLIWNDDLRQRYGLDADQDETDVRWGRAASPLILGQAALPDLVVVPGGGPRGKAKNLIAFEAATGRLVWESENPTEAGIPDQISYASPSLATLAGRQQILIVNESTASGHDSATGERLWSYPWPGGSSANASASQAVAIDANHVLLSKGYSGGAELIEIQPVGQAASLSEDQSVTGQARLPVLQVTSTWKSPRLLQTKLTNVVVHDGHAYGLSEGILECVEIAKGQRKWKSGRFGHGQILGVGSLLLVLSEEGELHLIELNTAKFVAHGSIQAIEGKTWNNLCLYGRQLLVRNAQEAACYELP